MAHGHFVDIDDAVKPCVEIDPAICLTPTTDGFLLHFEPAHEGGLRQMGGFRVGAGAWSQTGTLEGGDLTISPSIKISTTVDDREVELLHGWIRGGRWVPA